jgi:hypothetical protein
MFKWRGPLDIKWDNPFGYPNYTWTLFFSLLSFFWCYYFILFFNLANILQVFNLKFAQNELVQYFPTLAHFIQLVLHAHNSFEFFFEIKLNSMPLQFPNNFEDLLKNVIFFHTLLNFIILHQCWMSYIYKSLLNKATKRDVLGLREIFILLIHVSYLF